MLLFVCSVSAGYFVFFLVVFFPVSMRILNSCLKFVHLVIAYGKDARLASPPWPTFKARLLLKQERAERVDTSTECPLDEMFPKRTFLVFARAWLWSIRELKFGLRYWSCHISLREESSLSTHLLTSEYFYRVYMLFHMMHNDDRFEFRMLVREVHIK